MTARRVTADLETFERTSVLRLPAAYDAEDALAMQRVVWDHLTRQGVVRTDPETWLPERCRVPRDVCRQLPLGRLRTPRLRGVLDDLLGRGKWEFAERAGILAGPPESPRTPWKVARGDWHWDAGHAGPWTPSEGLFLWCPLVSMPERSGGTMLLEGSRSLLGDFMAECEARSIWSTAERFATWHPYTRRLFGLDPADDPDDFLGPFVDDVGRHLRVSEVTGEPGDVVLTDADIVHRIPQHHGSELRVLMLHRVGLRRPEGR
jgi:hypothetical protein